MRRVTGVVESEGGKVQRVNDAPGISRARCTVYS